MKKLLSVVLAACLIFSGVVGTFAFAAEEEGAPSQVWDGTVASSFASGTGLKDDPFIIETAEQLAYLVSVGASGKYIKLANDIYLNDTSDWTNWETNPPQNAWVSTKDCGYFDGDNHTIYGLYCYAEKAALFYSATTVSNLTIKDSYVYGTTTASGIVHTADEVINCHNYSTIKSERYSYGIACSIGTIENCHNFGDITAETSASGICAGAYDNDVVKKCSNHGKINATEKSGGICVYASCGGLIEFCYNLGDVVSEGNAGGISAEVAPLNSVADYFYYPDNKYSPDYLGRSVYQERCIKNSYNAGTIIGENAGGITGYLSSECPNWPDELPSSKKYGFSYWYEPILRCYNTGVVNGNNKGGQIVGLSSSIDSYIYGKIGETRYLHDYIGYTYYYNPAPTIQYAVGHGVDANVKTLSKSEALLQESYEKFDFENVWVMSGNPDYPYPELKDNLQPHEHTYSETVNSEATCTQDGSKTLTCWCGYTYDEVIPTDGHKYEETVIKEATCTEDGLKTLLCFCGDTYDEAIPSPGHEYEVTEVEATCTQAGYKSYLCHCGDTYTETIPTNGHNIITVTVEPTCTEDGETYAQCTVCKTVFGEKEILESKGHAYQERIDKNASCTQSGSKVYTCHCGDEYTEVIPATGHALKLHRQENTCTSAGFEYYVCENCGNMIGETEYLPKLGHSYKESIISEADCTSDGEILYSCERCEDSYTKTITASGHTFGEWTVTESTCTQQGMKQRVCAECSETEIVELPLAEHNWEKEFTVDEQATCEQNGSKSIHCADCEATKDITVITASGHSFGEWTGTEPTCTQSGVKQRVCAECSKTETVELPMTEHNWEKEFTIDEQATCEQNGSKSIHCADCEAAMDVTVINAAGHTESDWIVTVAPTKKTDGKQIRKCTSCGVTLAEEILPKTLGPSDRVHSVSIDNASVNYKNSVTLRPTINIADGINYRVEYSSSDSSVARVDGNGNVYGAGTGSATITCTVIDEFGNTVSDTCKVEVSYQWWEWIIVIVLFGWIWY